MLLAESLAAVGIALIFMYCAYDRVDKIGVTAFDDGLGSGSCFTSTNMHKGDVLLFGRLVGPARVRITVTVPASGEPSFLSSVLWESDVNLTTIQDSWGQAFAAPYDGGYVLCLENFGSSQEQFRVWVEAGSKEVVLLYLGLALLAGGAIATLVMYFKVHYTVRKLSLDGSNI